MRKKGISCPDPTKYPKRFSLYVKSNRLSIESFEEKKCCFYNYVLILLCIISITSILSL